MIRKINVHPVSSVSAEKYAKNDAKDVRVNFYSFCSKISLHGWKYLKAEQSFAAKMIWIFVLVVSLVMSAFFTHMNVVQGPILKNGFAAVDCIVICL